MGFNIFTVSEIVGEIKRTLEDEFRSQWVEGEVSNLTKTSSGHWYFDLLDNSSSISCALFKMNAFKNPLIQKVKNGQKLKVFANVGVYQKRGTFQLIVSKILASGKGDIKEQFEALKRRLASEGLFDIAEKKEIAKLPKRVAVLTAKRAAALTDFINVYKRRSISMDILVIPCLVQGDKASRSIRNALSKAIKLGLEGELDTIVITRGGGSSEDLFAFNDEALAWDIFNSPIPVISAVGHEIDYTICDYVADLRCETPSAAAEILTEYQGSLLSNLQSLQKSLCKSLEVSLLTSKSRLQSSTPRLILDNIYKQIVCYEKRVNNFSIQKYQYEFLRLDEKLMNLDDLELRLIRSIEKVQLNQNHRLSYSNKLLSALDPKNILNRGYSYLQSSENNVIGSILEYEKLENEATLNVFFHDGKAKIRKV